MKFLIDNALSPIIAQGLQKAGFEAIHVRDVGLHSASDSVIFESAVKNAQIIVSADTDLKVIDRLVQIDCKQGDKLYGINILPCQILCI